MEQQHNKNMAAGVASVDVKKLKDAGLCTVEAVAYSSRNELLLSKGISEIIKLSSDEAVRTPRTDVKEFFWQARSTSFYKQFGAFLVNIEELNSQNRTRELKFRQNLMIVALEEMALKRLQQSLPAFLVIPYPFSSSVWWIEIMQLAFGFIQHINKGIHTLNSSLGSFSQLLYELSYLSCLRFSLPIYVRYLHGCRHSLPDGLMRVADVMVDGEIVVAAG
ncbi:hypothetical protein C5167_035368 [Papaver somniferum]|uniref:At4g15545-like C-terminal domain-containing protein n=1 Tax=Papaver somniferum TaxID=3469 RepID=A0A4Y7KIJ3_PAPSO|nr:hypothetical protein C5167_035368 [Papaver somniferum]